MFGDYELLCHMYGLSGASGMPFLEKLHCRVLL